MFARLYLVRHFSPTTLLTPNWRTTPLVSVIVPVYNVEKYLRQCLDSVVNQTYKKSEIVCVNDGSTDQSLKILEEYQQKDSRIKIITQVNQGLSAARNTGLKNATGELILFVDSDDWLEKTAIASTYKIFANNEVDFVSFGTMCRYETNSQNDRPRHVYKKNEIKLIDGSWEFEINVSAWSKMYRASFLKDHGLLFPVGLYYEDIYFHWGCISFAKKVALSNAILYNYRIRDDSIMGQSKTKKKGMAIHHLYGLEKVYQLWNQNGFLNSNKDLFQFIFELYVQAGWKYLHDDDKTSFIVKTASCARKWNLCPKRYTLAYDLIVGNRVFLPKYRWARSLRKKRLKLHKFLGRFKNGAFLKNISQQ